MEVFKKFSKLDKYTKLTILVIVIGSILRFILALYYPASSDTAWHLNIARFIAENHKLPVFEPLGRPAFSYPPLFHFLAALFYKVFSVFGENIANRSMHFVVPIFSSLVLIVTYLIVKKISNKKVAFYAVMFCTFIPVHFFHSYMSFSGMPFAFFVILSVYLALNQKWVWSAIALGLSNNVRIYGIFMIPLLIYIIYTKIKPKQRFIKKVLIFVVIVVIIASPVFIRNYIHFKNPVWPGLGYIFGDSLESSWQQDITKSSFKPFRLYWGFFGIPNENPSNFLYLDIPYVKTFFVIWFIATLIFSLPIVVGIWRRKVDFWFLGLWSLGVMIPMGLFELQTRAVPRHFLPMMPVFGILWGAGMVLIIKRLRKTRTVFKIMIILIICGFTLGEIVKTSVAKSWWDEYNPDYNWVRENIPKNALVHYPCQTLSYHIHRLTPSSTEFKKGDYIWLNEHYRIEVCGIWPQDVSQRIKEDNLLVYQNNRTETRIYKVV